MISIGNDIVDLTHRENRGKSRDRRFLSRVFTVDEQARIDGSEAPDDMLWTLWAAKEAAFKAVVKGKPGTPFVPRAYAVALAPLTPDGPHEKDPLPVFSEEEGRALRGVVMTPAGPVGLSGSCSPDRVHCVAVRKQAPAASPAASCVRAFASRLNGPSEPSAALRWEIIHDLSAVLKMSPYFIRIGRERTPRGDGPPRVFLEGRRADIDISLSHDGRYIAFALHVPGCCLSPENGG